MTKGTSTDDIFNSFEASLRELRIELSENINAIDVLDPPALHKYLDPFNNKLTILLHDFLESIPSSNFSSAESIESSLRPLPYPVWWYSTAHPDPNDFFANFLFFVVFPAIPRFLWRKHIRAKILKHYEKVFNLLKAWAKEQIADALKQTGESHSNTSPME